MLNRSADQHDLRTSRNRLLPDQKRSEEREEAGGNMKQENFLVVGPLNESTF